MFHINEGKTNLLARQKILEKITLSNEKEGKRGRTIKLCYYFSQYLKSFPPLF